MRRAAMTSRRRPLLIIFDDVSAQEVIRDWIPHGNVKTLITSRQAHWDSDTAIVALERFSVQESVEFLLSMSGRHDMAGAHALASQLEGHPLALSMAALTLRRNASLTFDRLDEQIRICLLYTSPSPRD